MGLPGGVGKLLENTRSIDPINGTHAHPDGVAEQTAITLTITGSMSKCFASPPHTPDIFRSVRLR